MTVIFSEYSLANTLIHLNQSIGKNIEYLFLSIRQQILSSYNLIIHANLPKHSVSKFLPSLNIYD